MSETYEVGELYKKSKRLEDACTLIFWANCLVTILALWPSAIQTAVTYLQIITAILHVSLGLVNDCRFWFDAESANRKHLIEDAFGVDITNRRSIGYYNNRFERSAERYVANAFESAFFSKSISEAMLPASILKSTLAVALLLLLLFAKPSAISLSDATQAVLSAYLVEDTILLSVFHSKIQAIYEDFYKYLISVGVNSSRGMVLMLAAVQEYECTKAFFKVRLDSKAFEEMNEKLSAEWDEIERRISFGGARQSAIDWRVAGVQDEPRLKLDDTERLPGDGC